MIGLAYEPGKGWKIWNTRTRKGSRGIGVEEVIQKVEIEIDREMNMMEGKRRAEKPVEAILPLLAGLTLNQV